MADTFDTSAINRQRFRAFGWSAAILTVLFLLPLARLAVFAAHDDLYSYILLMPLVSLYLAHLEKPYLPATSPRPGNAAWVGFTGGILMLAW